MNLRKNGKYKVLVNGCYLNKPISMGFGAFCFDDISLTSGDIIEYLGERNGIGSDNISLPLFRKGNEQGEFSPTYWGCIENGFLEELK